MGGYAGGRSGQTEGTTWTPRDGRGEGELSRAESSLRGGNVPTGREKLPARLQFRLHDCQRPASGTTRGCESGAVVGFQGPQWALGATKIKKKKDLWRALHGGWGRAGIQHQAKTIKKTRRRRRWQLGWSLDEQIFCLKGLRIPPAHTAAMTGLVMGLSAAKLGCCLHLA